MTDEIPSAETEVMDLKPDTVPTASSTGLVRSDSTSSAEAFPKDVMIARRGYLRLGSNSTGSRGQATKPATTGMANIAKIGKEWRSNLFII
jgi:hypothetical protein